MTRTRKIFDGLLIALFFAAIWLPLGAGLAGIGSGDLLEENRNRATRPGMPGDLDSLEAFPQAFEDYYNDRFGLRDYFITYHNLAILKLFSDSSHARVLAGKEGWLFYKGGKVIEDYRSLKPFTDWELKAWARVLEERRLWLKKRGIEYLVVFVPNKHTIYADFMPDHLKRTDRPSRLDQLVGVLEEKTRVNVLDLRPVLLEAKEDHRVYHKTDTHWNDWGAFLACNAMLERLAPLVPGVAPLPVEDTLRNHVTAKGLGLAVLLGLERYLSEEEIHYPPRLVDDYRIETDKIALPRAMRKAQAQVAEMERPFAVIQENPDLPDVVVFRDSFFTNLVKYFASHFRKSVYYWQYDFDGLVIEKERPDVVVQEIVERELMKIKPRNPDELRPR